MKRCYRSPSGFTLVELLVATGVLAILIALLFPVFNAARHSARMTACASNLHQVGLALKLYSADYDEHYPPNNADALQTKQRLVWTLLTPYTHDARVFHCPEERGVFDKALGYEYGAALMGSRVNPYQRPPRPGSGTVVAWCAQHTERSGEDGWVLDADGKESGPLVVVREDGSASRVQASQVTHWIYNGGQWQPGQLFCPPDTICTPRFPGEEWPPEFEQ